MRLLGVETSIKTTNNTTRTSTIIARQQQKHFKNECIQTNKQTNKQTKIKETRTKKATNKHTNNQQKNKHTNKQRTNRHNTSSTRAILPTHNSRKNSNNKKITSDQRISEKGKMKRTLERELKEFEIAESEVNGATCRAEIVVGLCEP